MTDADRLPRNSVSGPRPAGLAAQPYPGGFPAAELPSRRIATIVASVFLTAHAGAVLYLASTREPTIDEPAHIAAGLYTVRTGRCDLYPVNPPLVKVLAAIPLVAVRSNWDISGLDTRPGVRTEWALGDRWIAANRGHSIPWRRQLFFARCVILPFSLLGGWVCLGWGTRFFGPSGGAASCGLWCGSPLVIENAAVVSMDVPAAASGLLAAWFLHRALERPGAWPAVAAGAALGFALNCKHTWVVAALLWPAVVAAWRLRHGARGWVRVVVRDAAVPLLVALLALNAGYGFEGTGTRLGDYLFVSETLSGVPHEELFRGRGVGANRFEGTVVGSLPLPVPREWLRGIDLQRVDLETPTKAEFDGVVTTPPPWAYLSALWSSEPYGTFAVLTLAAAGAVRSARREALDAATLLLLPAVTLLGVVSSQVSGLYYPRYALPGWAFILVCGGGSARCGGRVAMFLASVVVVEATIRLAS